MTSVPVSYNLNLGPSLPDNVIDIAKRQGEDPDLTCSYLQELKDMIYGKTKNVFFIFAQINVCFCRKRGICTTQN